MASWKAFSFIYPHMLEHVTREARFAVMLLNKLQETGRRGILAYRIKSIMPPLLSDHVLREANHYLRLLRELQK